MSINRLLSQKTSHEYHQKKIDLSNNRAKTRTLIQLGSLVDKIGLTDLCGIELGDDLDLHDPQNKAALLIGILTKTIESITSKLDDEQQTYFKNRGIKKMKNFDQKSLYHLD